MSLDITLYDNHCEHCGRKDEVYALNITGNLVPMAHRAHIYEELWDPKENGIERAKQLIFPLEYSIALLETIPSVFKRLNPSNGWGSYEGFLYDLKELLMVCKKYPEATIEVWR